MDPSVGTVSISPDGVNYTALAAGDWSLSYTVYTVPYDALQYSTQYRVKAEDFQDSNGNPMLTDTTHTFTTRRASGGGGGYSEPSYNAVVSGGGNLYVTVDRSSGAASVTVGDTLGAGLQNGGNATITMPSIPGVTSYKLGIPVAYLSTSGGGTLTFTTDTGSIALPADMLSGVAGSEGKKAEISIGVGDKTSLPSKAKAAIGARPLIELSLTLDGVQTDWSNPNAPVTISIPYEPTSEELQNPDAIIIWYIDGSGNLHCVPNGRYDPETGTVTFKTTHFSLYAIGYNPVGFNDVPDTAQYAAAVRFIAARGISKGTGGGNFSPEAKLSRGQFIYMLMKAYDIAPDPNPEDNFADAGNAYYTNCLATAKRLGISAGVGNNLFAPEKDITRQEMFTMLYKALRVIDRLPRGNSGKALSDFTDAGQIAPWAKEAITLLVETGAIGGSSGKLTPDGVATRAEMAELLYNLLGK